MLQLPCMLVCSFVSANRTRDRGCSKHPVFPAPSVFRRASEMKSSGSSCREIARSYSVVIVREGGRSSIPETAVMESIGRGVLDPPHARGMTAGGVARSLLHRQRDRILHL